ncbi:hypothetical protein NQ318_018706 [Aromia moschata]|uniref:adenine phosphoribosyltransferase n=1 Tax=Aromia moschata TaxID=1265417 RepID=A0AAV8ZGZ3_9CUCU|nr:hypothetical protein NQ318_018706 [Aromia moschata]
MPKVSNMEDKLEVIKNHIKSYSDFPKKGILFWDIFSVLQKPDIFRILKEVLIETVKTIQPPVECVAALDARGFFVWTNHIFRTEHSFRANKEKGKTTGKSDFLFLLLGIRSRFTAHFYNGKGGKEDIVEIQVDSIRKGQRVLIVDDLLATGGSLKGACELIKQLGGDIAMCLVVMELEELEGRKKVSTSVTSLIKL